MEKLAGCTFPTAKPTGLGRIIGKDFRKSNVSRAGQRSFYERSLKGAARAHFTEQRLIIGPLKIMDFSNDAEENL